MAMRPHRGTPRATPRGSRTAELAFEALSIEGGLLAADWLARVARLAAPHQEPDDYGILKGLELRDEIGRYWRIAQAHWADFAAGLKAGAEPEALARRFMLALLRDAFGFADLGARASRPPGAPPSAAGKELPGLSLDGPDDNGREPIMLGERAWPLTAIDPAGRIPLVCAPAGSGLDTTHPSLGDGHRKRSAFGLIQEFLNTADQALWGLCADGLRLRLVRDNASLTRPAWVELDLARVFTEDLYPDFAAAWLLLHRSRFGRADQAPDACPLEVWRSAAREEGTRARDRLRGGFEDALLTLGQGFLAHPANQALRQALHDGSLGRYDYFGQLLRLVYRFIFLLTVEERGLLHPKNTPDEVQERYAAGYGLQRLRDRAARRAAHDRHDDLWEALKIVFRGLTGGEPGLGLPALVGLFAPGQCPDLDAARLDNRALLGALFSLCWLREPNGLARVNWRDMGSDELGYVYEGLLELTPQVAQDGRSFRFAGRDESRGNARKTSGSYYTPDSLVEILLDSALDPVIEQVVSGQWRVASGSFESEREREDTREILSRVGGLGAGDAGSRGLLPDDAGISEGGDVRDDLADPTGGSFHSSKHRGRLGTTGRQGVLPVSEDCQREPARAGDTLATVRSGRPHSAGGRPSTPGRVDDPLQTTPRAAEASGEWPVANIHSPFATHHLPLTTCHSQLASEALLRLAIIDPACGSGHFLLAAARRLAARVASLRAEGTPTPEEYRHALRAVVGRCIYGVDLNPLAVELCKVALWLEAVDPGLPLTFLDAHIRHGNALLGTTRALMEDGIPDEAWVALEGDDKKLATALKKKNKAERGGQRLLPFGTATDETGLLAALDRCEATPDTDAASLARKEACWLALQESEPLRQAKLVHDAWCAAFLWPKDAPGSVVEAAPTESVWRALADGEQASAVLAETAGRLADEYALFHWELAFPRIFERGGFDVVLGNPPWERVKLQEQEFFASRDDAIAGALNAAARKRLIVELPVRDPELWEDWSRESRVAQGTSHFARQSGRYPLCGKGDVNTYALFAEHNWRAVGPTGRAGFILPTGIATDDTTKDYFGALVVGRHLARFYGFENEAKIFRDVDHRVRFALLSIDGAGESEKADLVFFARYPSDLDQPDRHFYLTAADFELLNPNTRTCPTFRSGRDARINLALYRRAGVLWREADADGNRWGLRFMVMFHMANDSGLFRNGRELAQAGWRLEANRFVKDGRVMLPLYEAKMIHHFDHRFGTYEGQTDAQAKQGKLPELSDGDHADPHVTGLPRYWVDQSDADARLEGKWDRRWLMGWRDITFSTNVRTVIASIIPRVAVGHKMPLAMPITDGASVSAFIANLSSFLLDYAARRKVGSVSLTYFILKQLPVLPPLAYAGLAEWDHTQPIRAWMLPRVVELIYTARDIQPFAQDCGDDGPPFIWDPDRRFQLQCELDAAFFHLYGVSREDTDYILGTFPVVANRDQARYGEPRTRRRVLECYDALAQAITTGQPYRSPLGPPRRAE